MKKIFCKYAYLNSKNVLFGLLSTIFMGLMAFDENKYYLSALVMGPSLLFSFVVGKMCYEEDSKSTKEFLLSMHSLKNDIIQEKNIVGMFCIFIGFIIINSIFLIANVIKRRNENFISIDSMLIVAAFLIIYNTLYIYLNYRFDYSKTRFAPYIILIFFVSVFKFGNELTRVLSKLNLIILIMAVIVIATVSLLFTKKHNWIYYN